MLRAGGTGTCMATLAHRMFESLFALAWLLAATSVAAAYAMPAIDTDGEVAAIERLLARGADAEALPRVEALIAALPATAPASRRADLQLLLARTHGTGETRHDEAIAAATRAIEGYGEDPAHAASVLQARQVRGVAWARKREPENALADLREVERTLRERHGSQELAYAQALSDLSLAQRVAADYGAALTSLENALAIHRRQPVRDAVALAGVLIRLGQTRRISGDVERAEAAYREALALDRATPDPSARNGATVLYALGNLYRNRDDPARAIPYYAEAVPAFERAWGADSVQLSLLYNNYGNAESLRPGRGEAAVALFRRALDIAVRNRSEDPGHYYPLANIAMGAGLARPLPRGGSRIPHDARSTARRARGLGDLAAVLAAWTRRGALGPRPACRGVRGGSARRIDAPAGGARSRGRPVGRAGARIPGAGLRHARPCARDRARQRRCASARTRVGARDRRAWAGHRDAGRTPRACARR
ncbi:MAG: tetratricopeptide repeat protein [Lysobacteraceae bacterium]|nr:MAG: tetratricopeptide repeat protein [Xanthomonadaceae bacterium]